MPGTRKLGRTSDQRKAMLRAMVTYLLENGKIETTVTRAKEVAAMTEKMITLGKAGDLHSKRQVLSYVTKEDVVKKNSYSHGLANMRAETAAIQRSSRSDHVVATLLKWLSFSWFNKFCIAFKAVSVRVQPFLCGYIWALVSRYAGERCSPLQVWLWFVVILEVHCQ